MDGVGLLLLAQRRLAAVKVLKRIGQPFLKWVYENERSRYKCISQRDLWTHPPFRAGIAVGGKAPFREASMSPRSRSRHPPRTANRFRERELARVVRAAKKGGGERVEIDPKTGRYFVILAKSGERVADNEVETWLSKQQGQHENQR
jgi:hypothetical protein